MTAIPNQPPVNHEAAAMTLMSTIRDLVVAAVPGFSLAAKGRRTPRFAQVTTRAPVK